MEMKIITINVRGLRNTVKRAAVFLSLMSMNFNICFLQECHLRDAEDIETFTKEWKGGYSFWGVGNVFSNGVGILMKGDGWEIENVLSVVPGRVLYLDVKLGNMELRVINVYAPSNRTERLGVFKETQNLLCTNRVVVMGGDFNSSLDKLGKKEGGEVDSATNYLKKLVSDFSLMDVYRKCNKKEDGYTWGNSQGLKSRIDYIFLSSNINVKYCKVAPFWSSDHSMIETSFETSASIFGPGYWKLNISVLKINEFREELIEFYKSWQNMKFYFKTETEWWEEVKRKLCMFCQKYCKNLKKKERRDLKILQNQLQKVESKINEGSGVDWEEYQTLKNKIKRYTEGKAREFAFLAKVEEKEGDEKCSRYFFQSIKQKQRRVLIKGFKDGGGALKEGADMMEWAREYYKKLFSKRGVCVKERKMVLENLDAKISNEEREGLEGEITEEEVKVALFSLADNKTPGGDGLPKEFYVAFWEVIKKDLVNIYKEIYKEGMLSESMRKGVISLIFKKGDKEEIKNWRPITLLTVDYKILSKILTNRLSKVMSKIIDGDQTCGVKGRSSSMNLQLIRDVIYWVTDRGLQLGILSLDQEKAFDRVNHEFCFEILKRFNLGERFIKWIRTLYKNVYSVINVNGHLSEPVMQRGGVRQGCPLSPLLYVIFIEPLAELVRRDKIIRGIHIPGGKGQLLKISQYADDTTLFLTTERGIERAVELTEIYGKASGSKVNVDKSSIMLWGNWDYNKILTYGFELCKDGLKILGVQFYRENGEKKNWIEKLAKIRTKMDIWKSRKLTVSGKVLVIKSDILPALNYLAGVYPVPIRIKLQITRVIFCFIWGGKYEWMQREQMYKPVDKGGRGVPCIPLKLDCILLQNMCRMVAGEIYHKAAFFVKMWFAFAVRNVWPVLNDTPKVEKGPWVYEHMKMFLKAHPECGSKETLLNHKEIYNVVKKKLADKNKETQVNHDWGRLQPKHMGNDVNDIAWLCAHDRLPVRERLYRHGCARSAACPRDCGGVETARHVFWECVFAINFWNLASQFLKTITDVDIMSVDCIMFGKDWYKWKKRKLLFVQVFVNVGKWVLWEKRNESVGKYKLQTEKQAFFFFKAKVQEKILIDKQVLGWERCSNKWGELMKIL